MKKIAIICDFDGTVAGEDVGNLLFRTFTENEASLKVVSQWKKGLLSSRDCLEQECALAKASRTELDRFIRDRKLDTYFKDFLDFTKKRGMELVILSDGLDYYIEKMLLRSGAAEVNFFANKMEMTDHSMTVHFPYFDLLDCKDCGNCKKYHLEKYREDGYFIVYVGDGLSDRCPAEHADMVFAKGDLAEHCRMNGIDHKVFNNFRDVERELIENSLLDDGDSGEFLNN